MMEENISKNTSEKLFFAFTHYSNTFFNRPVVLSVNSGIRVLGVQNSLNGPTRCGRFLKKE